MQPAAAPARAEAARDSRDEILRAAADVFMEFGFAATTIDAIAERLGATKGRVYHHYKSKAELFFAVQLAAMERLKREIEPIARGVTPWWNAWRSALEPIGGQARDWRFRVERPALLRDFDKSAGLDHRELTARSLGVGI